MARRSVSRWRLLGRGGNGLVATSEGIKGEDVRDLMVTAVEHRFRRISRLPERIEWLTDNGSGYVAHDTRRFARDIGFEPRTNPVESPNQMEWQKRPCAQ